MNSEELKFNYDVLRANNHRLTADNARLTAELSAERERNRWIPVSDDDMPYIEDGELVSKPMLIRVKDSTILTATYDGDKWQTYPFTDYFIDPSNITHWRPLPAPPEVK